MTETLQKILIVHDEIMFAISCLCNNYYLFDTFLGIILAALNLIVKIF